MGIRTRSLWAIWAGFVLIVACSPSKKDYPNNVYTPEIPKPDAGPGIQGNCEVDTPGPVERKCLAPTESECDGSHDVMGFPANGTGGNGFDDDCDGLVDEGCRCEGPGTTKDCYLVPAAQTVGGLPVGWCAQNSKGSADCIRPMEGLPVWSGQCRGAQQPALDDQCSSGDFDCDGKDKNARGKSCVCEGIEINCPTEPLQTLPYPPSNMLPLKIDASTWFANASDVARATNWKWTLTGGDCDNILPHPTFAIFNTADGSQTAIGAQVDTLGMGRKEHGIVAGAPGAGAKIYPAFSTSGDYVLQGEFSLGGKRQSCQQKIQVRAPGIRAELCWDTAGETDIDLHVAKIEGFPTCAAANSLGWSGSCTGQDCNWTNCKSGDTEQPRWFADSPATACVGWGSSALGTCGNPRLDRDNVSCDRSETNPRAASQFCGSENINVDAPVDGSQYAVAVRYFSGSVVTRPHVNLYCNGARILSSGYNPLNGASFPKLAESGGDTTGDMWKVGIVKARVMGGTLSCEVSPTTSMTAHAATDGSTSYCVDNTSRNGLPSAKLLTSTGAAPATAPALCFH